MNTAKGYVLNLGDSESVVIHRAACTYAEDRENDPNWWGVYATLGAAIDAGDIARNGRRVWEARCCQVPLVNPS